jgi:dephospho-CoA kinase
VVLTGVRVVGLTGGIASGKSTVAALLRARGAPVIDADQLAREVVAPGSEGLAAITRRFGDDILDAGGALDRKKLAAIVFSDEDARRDLERITHPRIAAASQRRIAELGAAGAEVAIYEAALIVENNLHRDLAALIVVAVDEETQIARLMARDGIDEAAARARVAAQLPLADKVAVADHVIDNSGDLAATERQVAEIWYALTSHD